MDYIFDSINKESLLKLYSEFGFRAKEIGSIVGVSEDAILKRLQQYGIPTNSRDKIRREVSISFTGKKKDVKRNLTAEELLRLCQLGYTDACIGGMYNMTGEGVAYRRKKMGITLDSKFNEIKQNTDRLINTEKEILLYDYYNLTQEGFSEKYLVSKTIWRPILNNKGIINKTEFRILKYPPLNPEQNILIIGSLLGDGSVSTGDQYYEFHSHKQEKYLRRKHKILEPYSGRITPTKDGTGLQFETVHHPNFRKYYDLFYKKGIPGKLIPVEFIKNNWHDHILAYWFFDDGHLDDEDNTIAIANFCPCPEQLLNLTEFLESHYHWGFKCAQNRVSFSKQFFGNFVDILLPVITPDMYYKIPEKFVTTDMAQQSINVFPMEKLHPKFYRKLDDEIQKKRIEKLLYEYFLNSDFPFCNYTKDRKIYLLKTFLSNKGFVFQDEFIIGSTVGLDLCESFFPNIYESKKKDNMSPLELWKKEEFLQRLSLNRLKYADRLTPSSIRTGIKLLSGAVSNFKPGIAKFLYQKYVPEGGRVFDYSCGFGSRMLAAMSLDLEYVGCDPNLKTFDNLNKFGSFLSEHTKGKYFVTDKGSEEFIYKENYFDFAFSSPPFFDYEIYSQDPGQSVVKYPLYEDWLNKFLKAVIENCYLSLISGGYFGFCISLNQHEGLIKKTEEFCDGAGFKLLEEFKAPYKQLFHRNEDKYDFIKIYRKV